VFVRRINGLKMSLILGKLDLGVVNQANVCAI
jgi:hypothetical protein